MREAVPPFFYSCSLFLWRRLRAAILGKPVISVACHVSSSSLFPFLFFKAVGTCPAGVTAVHISVAC